MKRSETFKINAIYIVLLVFGFMQVETIFVNSTASTENKPLVTLEFVYQLQEAGEVFFVWGINGWAIVEPEQQPSGTTVKKSMMHTPMAQNQGAFTVKLQIPFGSIVDYVFLITKKSNGNPVEVWDVNSGKDYHASAVKDGKYEVKKQTLDQAKGTKTDLFSEESLFVEICVVLFIFMIFHIIIRRKRQDIIANPFVQITSTALSLCFFLVFIRSHVLGFDWRALSSPVFIPKMILAGYFDLIYVGTLTAAFLVLCILAATNKSIKTSRFLYHAYIIIALFSLLVSLMNMKFIPILGKPFTYQFLYYADFLGSFDTKHVIQSNISLIFILNIALIYVAMILFSSTINFCIHQLLSKNSASLLVVIVIGLLTVYFSSAKYYINNKSRDYSRLENPVVAFIQSFINSGSSSLLFTMKTSFGSEDFQPASLNGENQSFQKNRKNHANNISNVIIYVLESVPAEYLNNQIMPELTKKLKQSAIFKNIYAHAPSTSYALVSFLCSIYPGISYVSLTQANPLITFPSLSSELKQQGYQTAFFSSADNRFQNQNTFLSARQFDIYKDYQSIKCDFKNFEVLQEDKWDFCDGVDDECAVNAFIKWAEEDRNSPFFGMLWTYQTHYPYFLSDMEKNFELKSTTLNRYLNALNHSDYSLGLLLHWLEENNLSESTLVVVVGDHGEAFGRHGQGGHASRIYEENLHVPLILINKNLFEGEEYFTVGGLIDVAPTILDILKFPRPPLWQGCSLFSNNRSERVYFFSPWFDSLFGFRQENLKFIFNASTHSYEVYDLNKDPEEIKNLAEHFSEFIKIGEQRLAAWVQFQNKFQENLSAPGPL